MANGVSSRSWKNSKHWGFNEDLDHVVVTDKVVTLCRQSGGPIHLLERKGTVNYDIAGRCVTPRMIGLIESQPEIIKIQQRGGLGDASMDYEDHLMDLCGRVGDRLDRLE